MARPLRFRSAYLHGYMLGATVIFGFGEQFILDLFLQDLRDAQAEQREAQADRAEARERFYATDLKFEPPKKDNSEGEK